jgi:hypothetical protein
MKLLNIQGFRCWQGQVELLKNKKKKMNIHLPSDDIVKYPRRFDERHVRILGNNRAIGIHFSTSFHVKEKSGLEKMLNLVIVSMTPLPGHFC